MIWTLREVRQLIAEVMEAEVLSHLIWSIMEQRELAKEVWDEMLSRFKSRIPKDHPVWRSSWPNSNLLDQFSKRWENREVSPGDFVIAYGLDRKQMLWRVIEVLGENSIKVESPRSNHNPVFITRWSKVGRYVLSDIAQKFIDSNKVDWRPDESLPEDFYSL